jgi:Tfp pilus assembly ATPase PilU
MVATMSFRDEVTTEIKTNGTICKTCRIIASLDPKERAEVVEVLADPNMISEAISRAMTRRGWKVGGSAIRKHRQTCLSQK